MMSAEDVLTDLKSKQLPTFGTHQERKERLKKAYGLNPIGGGLPGINYNDFNDFED